MNDDLERARALRAIKEQGRSPVESSRLSVMLPLSMHTLLKMRALNEGKTIREYIIGLLEKDGIK